MRKLVNFYQGLSSVYLCRVQHMHSSFLSPPPPPPHPPCLSLSLSLFLSLSEPQADSSNQYLMSAITKMEATLQAVVHERKSAHSHLFSLTCQKRTNNCFGLFGIQCIQAKNSRTLVIFAAQNKNWAHPKDTTSPRIRNAARFVALSFSKTQIWWHFWVCLRHCTSEPFDSRRLSKLAEAILQRKHCVVTLPSSACHSFICLIFSTSQNAATAFVFKHKKTIDVTDLSWPKTMRHRFQWPKAGYAPQNWNHAL